MRGVGDIIKEKNGKKGKGVRTYKTLKMKVSTRSLDFCGGEGLSRRIVESYLCFNRKTLAAGLRMRSKGETRGPLDTGHCNNPGRSAKARAEEEGIGHDQILGMF